MHAAAYRLNPSKEVDFDLTATIARPFTRTQHTQIRAVEKEANISREQNEALRGDVDSANRARFA